MLSEKDIMDMLKGYVRDQEVQKELEKQGITSGLSKEEMRAIAQDLVDALYQAGRDVVKTQGRSLFWKGWGSDGSWKFRVFQKEGKVRLSCDDDSLKRKSFAMLDGKQRKTVGYTGGGVYDIVGLFTRGYRTSRFVTGFWETAGVYSRSHNIDGEPGLAPNPFIDNVIDAFKAKYSREVSDVQYPSLWHSR